MHGPSIIVGGSDEAYERLGPIMESIAAQVDGEPCCAHVGVGGAGHFVKMVHNGIEYADMQLIAESYDLLRSVADQEPPQIAATFREWKLNQRRAGGGIKYDYFLSKRAYFLATSRVLGDTLANLDLRYTAGVGLGYTWVENGDTTFLTEVGASYFNESYRNADPDSDYLAVRAAYKLIHQFTATTRLVHGVEAFPSTEDASDLYLRSTTEVTTSLTESMLAALTHILDYDNTPATGSERVDSRFLPSIGWSF